MDKINLHNKLELISDYWNPRILAELNGQYVKLAKIKGEFVWHKHDEEDEMFFVVKGKLMMHFRDRIVEIGENEVIVVPKGVEHKPVAEEEVSILLFEPKSTLNTGNIEGAFTKRNLENI